MTAHRYQVDVVATMVKLLFHRRDDRGMELITELTRCVRGGEVHELVTTDHRGLRPADRVDRVGFLGFAEIANAGVIGAGDRFVVDGREVGIVVGFDACHHPNHYNILIETTAPLTAEDLELSIGQRVSMLPAPRPDEQGPDEQGPDEQEHRP